MTEQVTKNPENVSKDDLSNEPDEIWLARIGETPDGLYFHGMQFNPKTEHHTPYIKKTCNTELETIARQMAEALEALERVEVFIHSLKLNFTGKISNPNWDIETIRQALQSYNEYVRK